jgi:hypothetical protein
VKSTGTPWKPGVLDELRQPKDRVARRVVVAVDEEEQLPLAGRAGGQLAVNRAMKAASLR